MTSILFIDDEPKIRTFVRISLQSEGYDFYEANSARQGLIMAEQLSPDLIILDLGLPDSDGMSVIQKLRQRENSPPIIVLSARDDEDVKILALDLGANDYLCKPFGVRELLARIRVLLRDFSVGNNNLAIASVMRFNQLEIDSIKHQVTLEQRPVNLTPKEYELLLLLAQQPQKLLEHDYLLTRLWGHQHRHNTQYLRVCVSQLRKKLNDDSDHPQFIETVPVLGYRFIPAPTV